MMRLAFLLMPAFLISINGSLYLRTAVILAGVGIWALGQWRRELHGKARIELARQVVYLALKFDSAFSYARGMMGSSAEYVGRPKSPDEEESKEIAQLRDERYARFQRLEKSRQILIELQHCSWQAEAIFGESLDRLLDPYFKASNQVSIAISIHFDEDLRTRTPENRQIIYSDGNDETGRSVKAATNALKTNMKKYLK